MIYYTTILEICQGDLRVLESILLSRYRARLGGELPIISGNERPLILGIRSRGFAEILVVVLLPTELNARGGERVLVADSVRNDTAVFLPPHSALHFAHLLLRFVGGVLPSLVGERRRIERRQLLVGVRGLGNAENYRVSGMTAVVVGDQRQDYRFILALRILPPLIYRVRRSRTHMRGDLPAVRAEFGGVLLGYFLRELRNASHQRASNRDFNSVGVSARVVDRPQTAVRERVARLPHGGIVVANARHDLHLRHVHLLAEKIGRAAVDHSPVGGTLRKAERSREVCTQSVCLFDLRVDQLLKLLGIRRAANS